MKIEILDKKDYLIYEKLAGANGCIFNSLDWLKMYGKKLQLLGIYHDNNELIGAFFLYKAKKLGLNYYINPPYTPHNGLFFENRAQNKSNQNTFEKNIMQLLAAYFDSINAKLFITALPFQYTKTQAFFWKNFKVIPNYTYRLDLKLTDEELENNITSEKRKSLKRAVKDSLIIKQVDDYKTVKKLILKTFDRKEKKLNTQLLDKILFQFANDTNSFAFVAYNNETAIAATFCIYDSETAYYLLGGYDSENKHHGAGVSTMWSSILHAKKIGLNVFDFEGSMLQEVEKYFSEFGGDLIPYFTINKAWLPIETILKLVKRNVF